MKQEFLFLAVLLAILLILIFWMQSTQRIPKNPILPSITTKHYQMIQGKLPPPKNLSDSKITGSLSFDHAMKIAQDYYQNQSYEESLLWAYRAYLIRPLDKEAWILYARSLAALGYKNEAYEILQYYKSLR